MPTSGSKFVLFKTMLNAAVKCTTTCVCFIDQSCFYLSPVRSAFTSENMNSASFKSVHNEALHHSPPTEVLESTSVDL